MSAHAETLPPLFPTEVPEVISPSESTMQGFQPSFDDEFGGIIAHFEEQIAHLKGQADSVAQNAGGGLQIGPDVTASLENVQSLLEGAHKASVTLNRKTQNLMHAQQNMMIIEVPKRTKGLTNKLTNMRADYDDAARYLNQLTAQTNRKLELIQTAVDNAANVRRGTDAMVADLESRVKDANSLGLGAMRDELLEGIEKDFAILNESMPKHQSSEYDPIEEEIAKLRARLESVKGDQERGLLDIENSLLQVYEDVNHKAEDELARLKGRIAHITKRHSVTFDTLHQSLSSSIDIVTDNLITSDKESPQEQLNNERQIVELDGYIEQLKAIKASHTRGRSIERIVADVDGSNHIHLLFCMCDHTFI